MMNLLFLYEMKHFYSNTQSSGLMFSLSSFCNYLILFSGHRTSIERTWDFQEMCPLSSERLSTLMLHLVSKGKSFVKVHQIYWLQYCKRWASLIIVIRSSNISRSVYWSSCCPLLITQSHLLEVRKLDCS